MEQPRHPITRKNALVIHFVMVMTIAGLGATGWVVRDLVTLDLGHAAVRVVRYLAVSEFVVIGFIIARLRSMTELMTPFDDHDAWWMVHGTRVLKTWVLCQGAAVIGSVMWLVTGDIVILLAVVLPAVLLLMRLAPTRWNADPPDHTTKLVP